MEYPGYGIYEGSPGERQILEDSESVLKFVTKDLDYKPENLVISGRSMGSGPSIHVASLYKVKSLLLVSPFLSIKEVVSSLVGSFVAMLLKERFKNEDKISSVHCPILLIHSKNDTLVPFSHSEKLKGK